MNAASSFKRGANKGRDLEEVKRTRITIDDDDGKFKEHLIARYIFPWPQSTTQAVHFVYNADYASLFAMELEKLP